MKLKDLGPFAVFRFQGRVYVKSSGMIQMLDRSGSYFDTKPGGLWPDFTEVEPVDLTSPRDGQSCPVCFGGGYEPGKYSHNAHGYDKTRCPSGCLVEGVAEPAVEAAKKSDVCECCSQPILDCEKGVRTEDQVSG